MIFHTTSIEGVYKVEIQPNHDFRGFFTRIFCEDEFEKAGIPLSISQINNSYNLKKGTIRGLHFQKDPYGEQKLFRCVAGEVYDVVVDIRPESPTYKKWEGFHISAENRTMIYVPIGVAHGYQALTDGAEMIYSTSTPYAPGQEGGVRWDDPGVGIQWPIANPIVTEKDNSWPNL